MALTLTLKNIGDRLLVVPCSPAIPERATYPKATLGARKEVSQARGKAGDKGGYKGGEGKEGECRGNKKDLKIQGYTFVTSQVYSTLARHRPSLPSPRIFAFPPSFLFRRCQGCGPSTLPRPGLGCVFQFAGLVVKGLAEFDDHGSWGISPHEAQTRLD